MTRGLPTAAEIFGPSRDRDGRIIQLTAASEITVRPVLWLWSERLALGALSLMAGREGIGKSICAYTLCALVTRGTLRGECFGTARAVLVAATEDSWEHTIVPRLMAAGADLRLVYRVDVQDIDVSTTLCLPRDLEELARVANDVKPALLMLDPLLSRLDVALDTHKDAEVRRALEPLVAFADEAGVCVLGLIHVNKSASADALTTVMGSRAFSAVARTVLFVMADPDDESIRLLGTPKNNLGRTDLPTLSFRIVGEKVAETPDGPVWTGRLEWAGESTRSIRDALEAATEAAGDRTATSEAADWLHDYLAAQGGAYESAAIKREGHKAGHSVDALKRARRQLRVVSESRGFPRHTYWSLVSQSAQPVGAGSRGRLSYYTDYTN
jgi:AAA domain-containing protein